MHCTVQYEKSAYRHAVSATVPKNFPLLQLRLFISSLSFGTPVQLESIEFMDNANKSSWPDTDKFLIV